MVSSSLLNIRLIVFLAVGAFHAGTTAAGSDAPPEWWSREETRILEPGAQINNYAPANLGQLKHIATEAKRYLDIQLWAVGGAGPAVSAVVDGFEPQVGQGYTEQQLAEIRAANYAPVNLGQLKAVAKLFYDRLAVVEYDTRWNLLDRGYPIGWPHLYPWNPDDPWNQLGAGDKTLNYSPANLGQLKLVFSFDLFRTPNPDGLPDWWKQIHFVGTENTAGEDDYDNDGESNALELVSGTDPTQAGYPGDQDGDGVSDTSEITAGTNPAKKDNPSVLLNAFGFSAP